MLTSDADDNGAWQAPAGGSTGGEWDLSGNTGTDPASNFIGTIDQTPLNFRSANSRGLQLAFQWRYVTADSIGYSMNILGGHACNSMQDWAQGCTIGGSGQTVWDATGFHDYPNKVADGFGTVAGGVINIAGDESSSVADAICATVGGRNLNNASASSSAVVDRLRLVLPRDKEDVLTW